MSEIREFLRRQLDAGDWTIGQVHVSPGIILRHVADVGVAPIENFRQPEDARAIARYDDAGKYRPLKTAPNLRRGWQLRLADLDALRLALDFFYPAALGTWLAARAENLEVVALRDTLARQTGMYRVTQLIRNEQVGDVIAQVCEAGCLRRRLWRVESGPDESMSAVAASSSVPVFCAEACNLFIAACRPVAKGNLPKSA